jgi:small subunit ribosomal protein S17
METKRQQKTGTVISRAGIHTVIVRVDSFISHPLYRKRMRTTKRFAVHDAQDICKVGDVISIGETRPLSATKRWEMLSVISSAAEAV